MKVSQNISLAVVVILMLVGLTSAAIMSSRAFDEQAESRNWVMRANFVYTSLDLNNEQKDRLQMGLTAYLTKGTTSEQQFIGVVREFLNGSLVKRTDADSSTRNDFLQLASEIRLCETNG